MTDLKEANMIAVIVELWPAPGQQTIYFELAAQLRPELNAIDGFISIERFESLATPGNICRCHCGAVICSPVKKACN